MSGAVHGEEQAEVPKHSPSSLLPSSLRSCTCFDYPAKERSGAKFTPHLLSIECTRAQYEANTKNKGYRTEREERLVSVILPSMHGTEVKYI